MSTQRSTLGDRIRKLMEDRGVSQVDLAKATGLDRAELNRLINNKRPPRADDIRVLAEYFGIHQLELVTGVELPPGVEKGVQLIVELEATALAERQRAERLQAQLAVLERVMETQRATNLQAALDTAQSHQNELAKLNASHRLRETRWHVELQTKQAEVQVLTAARARLEGALEVLEGQNEALRKRFAEQASAAGAQTFFAGLIGLALGGGPTTVEDGT